MGRRTLGVLAAGLVALLAGCGDSHAVTEVDGAAGLPSPVDAAWPAVQVPETAWSGWQGTMADVRAWTDRELADLGAPVDQAFASRWTATYVIDGARVELAHTAAHSRVRLYMPGDHQWWAEVHVLAEPPPDSPQGALPIVACSEGQDGMECVGFVDDPDATDPDPFLVGAARLAEDLAVTGGPAVTDDEPATTEAGRSFLTRLESPAGPLDCLVDPPGSIFPSNVEGEVLVSHGQVAPGYRATCVDSRGLVLVAPAGEARVRQLTAADPTADADLTSYPADVDSYRPVAW